MNFRSENLHGFAKRATLGTITEDLYADLNAVRLLNPEAFRATCVFIGKGGRRWKLTLEIDPQEDPS